MFLDRESGKWVHMTDDEVLSAMERTGCFENVYMNDEGVYVLEKYHERVVTHSREVVDIFFQSETDGKLRAKLNGRDLYTRIAVQRR